MATKQKPITISDVEISLLQAYAKAAPLVLIRFKAQAVLLAANGVSPEAMVAVFVRKPSTIEQWLEDWQKRRLSSIFTGHQDNHNAGKLTPEQKAEVQQVLQSPPSDFGLPKTFWDVPQLKQYIQTQFDVVYECADSYHFMLKFGNLSFKYADTFDRKRDEAFIAERMKAIQAELAPLMKDDDWEVFAVDEVRLQQEAIIRKAWLRKGERTIGSTTKRSRKATLGFSTRRALPVSCSKWTGRNPVRYSRRTRSFYNDTQAKRFVLSGIMHHFTGAVRYEKSWRQAAFLSECTSLLCLRMPQTTIPLSMSGTRQNSTLPISNMRHLQIRSRHSPASYLTVRLAIRFSGFCFWRAIAS
jgi:transposase